MAMVVVKVVVRAMMADSGAMVEVKMVVRVTVVVD